jgi:orotidine-5'-phosphate decarboxylase
MGIIDQLIKQIDEKNCPIVMGLDPVIQSIPAHIKSQALSNFGNTIKAVAESFLTFNREILHKVHSYIPAVKLQMACYEIYGAEGINVFYQTVELAKQFNLIVIDDSKRNDIGNTANLYAAGHIGQVPLIDGFDVPSQSDFVTINPYLGSDSILPFSDVCKVFNKGIFVLVRTSNCSAAEYQEAKIEDQFLFEKVAEDVQKLAKTQIGNLQYSAIGAVVGATWPEESLKLRKIMKNVFFLVPGYGAQGGTADQVTNCFDENGYGALINSSRGIIFAYQQPKYMEEFPHSEQFVEATISAIREMKKDLLTALSKAGKLPGNW